MKTKTIILISAAAIVLSTTLAFRAKTTEPASIAKEEKSAQEKSGGFALEDQDQWK